MVFLFDIKYIVVPRIFLNQQSKLILVIYYFTNSFTINFFHSLSLAFQYT